MISRSPDRPTRRALLVGAAGVLAAPAIVRAQGQSGVALVIGNSKYSWEASLPNVKRDVVEVARTCEAMGLKTSVVQDAGRGAMREAIDKLAVAARGADLAVFYFAGHGAQWGDNAYLVPIDADLSVPKTDGLVYSGDAIKAAAVARLNFNAFDNCRNNPADGWRQKEIQDGSISKSSQIALKKIIGPRLNLWSTSPGRVAIDGPPGENSPFALALLRQLDAASVDIMTLAPKLRRDLIIATQGRQVATDFNAYNEPHSFKGARLGRPAADHGVDASRVCELSKAYAFGNDNRLFLPAGLVAIRPQGNSRYAQMIGSFRYIEKVNGETKPLLLMVLRVDDNGIGQVILAGAGGAGWHRFREVKLSENRLEYMTSGGFNRVILDWHGADRGSFSVISQGAGWGSYSGSFTRLDG